MAFRVLTPAMFAQSRNDPDAYRRSCKIVLRGVSVFGVLAALTLALLARPLLVAVFGAPFGAAALVLAILALSLALRLIALALQIVLSASGDHTRRTGSMAAGLGTAALANVILIPSYGIAGAAIARVTADLVSVRSLAGARKLPVAGRAIIGWTFGPVSLGVAAYVLALLIPVHFVLQFAVAIAAYALGLLSTRMIHVDELRELAKTVRLARSQ